MSGTQPVGVYAMKVPPGDILLPAVPDFAAMFRVSMAAIDPTEAPTYDENDTEKKAPRATLKIVRIPGDMFGDDEDDSEEEEDDDDEMDLLNGLGEDSDDESDEEEVNGGPSEPKKEKAVKFGAEEEADDDNGDMEDISEDDAKAITALKKIMKGKGKATAESSDEDEDDLDDDDPLELEEVVICTLDPEKNCQQTLDFVVGEDERVFFKVTGTHTVHLTGNYVIPMDDGQAQLYDDEEEEDYDLSPDEEDLDDDALEALGDEESDDLDDLEDPRVTEVASEDEAPALLKATQKGKNKRPAEDSADEEDANLDDLIATSLKKEEAAPATNGDSKKLSKAEKKALKKLKKNDGGAASITPVVSSQTPEPKKEAPATNGSEKKSVQFAENLEQGPTPSATPPAKLADKKGDTAKSPEKSGSLGVKDVQGIEVDDRKLGSGPVAKKGSRVEMRYIGKLESGKVFDSNKKGKPFSFKVGMGEVIKGWDLGVAGISVGGERRLTIPAHHGYGKKGAPPDIPPNSKLIFDIKCLSVS